MTKPEDATTNLYDRQVEGPFAAFCSGGNNKDGNMEDCLSLAELAGGGYALRDTKAEGEGRELRMSFDELTKFSVGWLETNGPQA